MTPLDRRSETAPVPQEASIDRWLEDLKARALRRSPELAGRGLEDPSWVMLEVFAEALAELETRAELVEERVFPRLLESLGDEPRWTQGATTALVFEPDGATENAVLVPRRTVVAVPRREGEARLSFETLGDAWTSSARLLRAVSTAGESATEIFPYPQGGWDSEGVALFAERQLIARHLYLGDHALSQLRTAASALVLEWPGSSQAPSEGTWEYSVRGGWRALKVEVEETTAGSRRAVVVRLRGPLVDLASQNIEGSELPWLRLGLEGGRRLTLAQPRWLRAEPLAARGSFPRPVERIYSHGGERWEDHSLGAQKIVPVESPENRDPAVYLGWDRPVPASLFWSIQGRPAPPGWAGRSGQRAPGIVWEYSSGRGFRPLEIQDDTQAFTRSGAVTWGLPPDWTPQEHLGERLHWVRARWVSGAYATSPVVRALLPHAMAARQQSTLAGVIIEASLDSLGRGPLRLPLAEGYPEPFDVIEIRQQGDWSPLRRERSSPAGSFKVALHPREGYQLDVGARWAGATSVRLPQLVAGWGARGNVPAGSLTVLEGAIGGVQSVVQPLPADGGRDAEGPEAFRTRIRAEWRSRGRAVTADDYRRLVVGLDPLVARVETLVEAAAPWRVKVCIIAQEPCQPGRFSPARLDWLAEMLEAKAPLGTVVEVVEAVYLPVEIRARRADDVPMSEAERRRIEERLRQFFHPLRGGPDGRGFPTWPWPYSQDVVNVLACRASEGDTPAVRLDVLRLCLELREVELAAGSVGTAPFVIPCLERFRVDVAEP